MKTFIANLRQMMTSHGFLAGVIGIVLAVAASSIEVLDGAAKMRWVVPAGFHSQMMLTVLSGEALTLSLPVLCALPFATSFLEDVSTGYIRLVLYRTTKRMYLVSKYLVCVISGFLTAAIGLLLSWGIAALMLMPLEPLEVENVTQEVWNRLPAVFAAGMLWAAVGMILGAVTESRFMAVASPFVLCYLLIILCERYFTGLFVFYPREFMCPTDKWPMSSWGAVIWIMEIVTMLGLVFVAVGKRRLGR